jgi:hypothetical protein
MWKSYSLLKQSSSFWDDFKIFSRSPMIYSSVHISTQELNETKQQVINMININKFQGGCRDNFYHPNPNIVALFLWRTFTKFVCEGPS